MNAWLLGDMGLTFRLDATPRWERLLVLLHGYGATQHDIMAVSSYVDPTGRFAVVERVGMTSISSGWPIRRRSM